eukprot:13624835-Heterocapsa_arctica.AAC.1
MEAAAEAMEARLDAEANSQEDEFDEDDRPNIIGAYVTQSGAVGSQEPNPAEYNVGSGVDNPQLGNDLDSAFVPVEHAAVGGHDIQMDTHQEYEDADDHDYDQTGHEEQTLPQEGGQETNV